MIEKEGSRPIYKVRSERDVYVRMRDGVELAIDILRPDAEGQFPALVAMSPYGKGIQSLPRPPQPPWAPLFGQTRSIEAGDPEYIVSRGLQ